MRAPQQNFLTPKTQLGGLLYRHKRVEKKGENGGGGNEIQNSPQNWPKMEIKGQVIVGDLKPKRALQQS